MLMHNEKRGYNMFSELSLWKITELTGLRTSGIQNILYYNYDEDVNKQNCGM